MTGTSAVLRAAQAQPDPSDGCFHLVATQSLGGSAVLLVAKSPAGLPAVLFCGLAGQQRLDQATLSMRITSYSDLEVKTQAGALRVSAVAAEILDVSLLGVFAAFCDDVKEALLACGEPSTEILKVHIERWATLFAAPRRLGEQEALGLWGELWVLATSSDPSGLLGGWCRADGTRAFDFVLSGRRLEVKTSRNPGIHHVSQTQIHALDTNGFMLSISAARAGEGTTIWEMVQQIASAVGGIEAVAPALRDRGLQVESVRQDGGRYVIIGAPLVYPLVAVPRVTAADAGVLRLRYEISMHHAVPLAGDQLRRFARKFFLPLTSLRE